MRFGSLFTIEADNTNKNGKTYYRCHCDCGNDIFISESKLISGSVTSCGSCLRKSYKRKNRVGERYGRLVVTEMMYNFDNMKSTYVRCKCDCGNHTIVNVGNMTNGRTSSCGCLEREARFNRNNHEKNLQGMKFGHLEVISLTDKRYSNGAVGWLCRCDCGNEIPVRSGSLVQGKTRSCGCSRTSKYEEFVESYLVKNNHDFKREYIFDGCKNKFPLRFDFYLPKHNVCIECQGQQHYRPVDYFGGKDAFIRLTNNDKIKKDFCVKNKIQLVCLPYTLTKDEVEKTLNDILNPCND